MKQILQFLQVNHYGGWLNGLKLFESAQRVNYAKELPSDLSDAQLAIWADILMSSLKELERADEMNEFIVKWKTSNPSLWLIGLKHLSLDQRASLVNDPPSNLSDTQLNSWVEVFMSSLK